MKKIIADKNLIAYCGLYCGACPRYLKGKCPGCRENEKAAWCKIRTCNRDNSYESCADCKLMAFESCKLNHNFMSRFFAVIFGSNRDACIIRIKEVGYEKFAEEMTTLGSHTIKRKK